MQFIQLESLNQMKEILATYGNSFIRPLDTRVGNFDTYACKLQQYALTYKILEGNREVGFFSFYANDPGKRNAYLSLIAMKKDCRGRGIGSKALKFICSECEQRGFQILKLEVDKENEAAIRFYKANGFQVTGEASLESFYMEKEIGNV